MRPERRDQYQAAPYNHCWTGNGVRFATEAEAVAYASDLARQTMRTQSKMEIGVGRCGCAGPCWPSSQLLVESNPAGTTGVQVRDVVKLRLRDQPETRHLSGSFLVVQALKEMFPCN